MQAIEQAGYTAGKDIYLALDCASSEFYKTVNTYLKAKAIKPLVQKVLRII